VVKISNLAQGETMAKTAKTIFWILLALFIVAYIFRQLSWT
jgi:cbb3-type cytochrome oxidase subunit 3